jgi:hypothetical protein
MGSTAPARLEAGSVKEKGTRNFVIYAHGGATDTL